MSKHLRYIFFLLFLVAQIAKAQIPFPEFQDESYEELDSISMSIDLDDIVVTAQYAPTDSKSALHNIRTINRTTIEQQGATNLEQLLLQDLNVRIQQDQITGSQMRLLGIGGENVKIMIDGVPVIGRLDGNIDLGQINLNNIERVEIIEGPMSVNFGTDAIGGVINLISRKSQLDPINIQLSQQLETRGENRSMLDAGIRLKDNLLLQLSTGYDDFSGFTEDGNLRNLPWNPKQQAYTNASLRHDFKEDNSIRYQFDFLDERVTDLGNVVRPQFKPYAFDNFYLTRRSNHAIAHEGSIGENYYWKNTLAYNHFNRKLHNYRSNFDENEQIFQTTESDTTVFQLWMLRSVFASRFTDSPFNFQVGIDLHQEFASGQRIYDINSDDPTRTFISDYAVFGTLRYRPSVPLTMELGMRASQNSRYNAPIVPSFRMKYQLNEDWQFRASYGRGFRSPSLKELFLNFIDTNHFILGFENLKQHVSSIGWDLGAETSDNIQLNLNYRKQSEGRAWSGQLQTFYNNIDNQIQLFAYALDNGEVIPDISSLQYTYFNIAKKQVLGANLRLNYQWKNWQFGSGFSRIGYSIRYGDLSDVLQDFTFANEWNARMSYHNPSTKTRASIFVRGNDRFVNYFPDTENNQPIVSEQIQDGFTMLDATITQQLWHDRLNLTIGARNLLDVQQVNLTGGSMSGHSSGDAMNIGVGRSFFTQIAYSFGGTKFEKPRKRAVQLQQIDNELYKTWIEEKGESATRIQYAKWKGKKWSMPQSLSQAEVRWISNEVDAPQLAKFPNSETLVRTWMQSSSRFNPYDQDLFISLSDYSGKTWNKTFSPYNTINEVSAFYGNCRLLPLPNNRMLALWLDGRDTKYKHKSNGRMLPKPGSKYTLRSLEFDESGQFYETDILNDQIVGLCPFDAIQTEEGILAVYRDGKNDINITSYSNGIWSASKTLTNENWYLPNTIEAPAADAIGKKVAVAWYTNPRNRAQVKLAFSDDNGKTFTAPVRIDEGKTIGKVDVLWEDEETAIVAWVEARDAAAQIVVVRYNFYGQKLDQQYFNVPLNRATAAVQLAKAADKILLSYRASEDTAPILEILDF